jgi:hypothetical protein
MNLTQPNDDEAARREYIRQTFGDDALEGLATDQPKAGKRRTADILAREPLAAAAVQQQEQDQELVQLAAAEQEQDQALDHCLRVMQRGRGEMTRGQLRKAARALERRGYHQGSTAERLARYGGQGEGWRPA